MSGRRSSSGPRYPRSARLNETLREVIAEELVRIDDERLAFVTITAIDVDNELNRAIVYFDSLDGEDGDADDPRGARASTAGGSRRRSTARCGRRRRRSSTSGPTTSSAPPSGSRTSSATDRDRPRRATRVTVARRRPPTVHGLAIVDKPAGVTSHDVVGMLRRRLGERRVGHAGTLDPERHRACSSSASATVTRLLRFVGDGSQALHRRGRARRRDRHARRRRRGRRRRHDMAAVTVDDARRVVAEHLVGADRAGAADGVGDPASTAGGCTSWPARASRSSAAPRPVTVDRFDVAADRRSGWCSRIDVDVLGGHVRPHARRRPRPPARRRRPPAQPAPHRRRPVHDRRGARRPTSASCSPARGACAASPVVDVDDATAALIANGRVLPAPDGRRPVGGRRDPAAGCSPSTSRSATGEAKPAGRARRRQHRAVTVSAVGIGRRRRGGRVASQAVQVDHRSRRQPPWPGERTVVTIGAYDGVHLGHQAVIADVRRLAAARRRPVRRAHVRPPPGHDRAPRVGAAAADRPRAALELLAATGIDATVVVTFDEAQSKEPPEEFVERVLVECLAVKVVVVGEDFHFGSHRDGNVALLSELGARARLRRRPDPPRRRAPTASTSRSAARPSAGPSPAARSSWRPRMLGRPARGARHGRRRRPARPAARVPDGQRRGAQLDLPARRRRLRRLVRAARRRRPPVRDQPRPPPDVLRARRPLAARGPPARLRRRPLRRAGAGPLRPLPAQRAQVRRHRRASRRSSRTTSSTPASCCRATEPGRHGGFLRRLRCPARTELASDAVRGGVRASGQASSTRRISSAATPVSSSYS